MLDTAGPHAERVAALTWWMTGGAAAILLLVLALTAYAVFAAPDRRHWLGSSGAIVAGGIVFPVVTLTVLLIVGLTMLRAIDPPAESVGLRIEVTGEQWWWRVSYLDDEGTVMAVSANEIRMPVGVPVEFVLKAADVIHSFWVPSLAGKLDMIPGRVNTYRFSAGRAGVYRGQCAEYCGAQHALMAFYAVAMEPQAFDDWLRRESGPAAAAGDDAARGARLFVETGCGACHTIRGTPAGGVIGPDLTHVGSRVSIAAGTLRNERSTLAAWIASAQHIKPEARMPSFAVLDADDLDALAGYLGGLK